MAQPQIPELVDYIGQCRQLLDHSAKLSRILSYQVLAREFELLASALEAMIIQSAKLTATMTVQDSFSLEDSSVPPVCRGEEGLLKSPQATRPGNPSLTSHLLGNQRQMDRANSSAIEMLSEPSCFGGIEVVSDHEEDKEETAPAEPSVTDSSPLALWMNLQRRRPPKSGDTKKRIRSQPEPTEVIAGKAEVTARRAEAKARKAELAELRKVEKQIRAETRKRKRHYCDLCESSFHNKRLLVRHRLSHTDKAAYDLLMTEMKKRFPCEFCSASFSKLDKLQTHHIAHTGERNYVCQICSRAYTRPYLLSHHFAKHHPGCEYEGPKKALLPNRPTIIVSKEKEATEPKFKRPNYVCVVCLSEFHKKSSLEKHLQVRHYAMAGKNFLCDKCPARLKSEGSLRLHQQLHAAEKRFVCEVCGYRAATQFLFALHMERHKGLEFSCPHAGCNAKSNTKRNLRRHIANKHNNQHIFTCKVCGMSFSYSRELNHHERSHAAEKPFACNRCSGAFTKKSGLRVHLEGVHKLSPNDAMSESRVAEMTLMATSNQTAASVPTVRHVTPISCKQDSPISSDNVVTSRTSNQQTKASSVSCDPARLSTAGTSHGCNIVSSANLTATICDVSYLSIANNSSNGTAYANQALPDVGPFVGSAVNQFPFFGPGPGIAEGYYEFNASFMPFDFRSSMN